VARLPGRRGPEEPEVNTRPRVLVVDDSAFMRSRIVRDLTAAGLTVAGEARSGEEGVELYRKVQPDFVTMDLTMRGQDGLWATEAILRSDPRACIVLYSMINDPEVVRRALSAGVRRYVHKSRPQELVETLNDLAGVAR
jgi:two-component system, chemotaxis family, chemotaxis protein CheY